MEEKLALYLQSLAEKYETPAFLEKDPSQFMHRFDSVADQEAVAFTAANLAFGRRDQILKHVEYILEAAGTHPSRWILQKGYLNLFPRNKAPFYRLYNNLDMILFFEGLETLLKSPSGDGTIGSVIRQQYQQSLSSGKDIPLAQIVARNFHPECSLVSHGTTGAAKKLNMMLRWLVRDNSPVDLGLWSSWYSKKDLIMPLDTHVVQEATRIGLFPLTAKGTPQSPSLKSARALTASMLEVFPDDPLKGDFALFGLGVDGQ